MATTFSMNALYNKKSLFSLSGASIAVWLCTTVIANVFNVNIDSYKWIGLIVALFLSLIGALDIKHKKVQHYTIIFFNGLLIYITACGIDSINHSTSTQKTENTNHASIMPFTESKIWWKPKNLTNRVDELEKQLSEQKVRNTELVNELKYFEDSCMNNIDVLAKDFDSLLLNYGIILKENKQIKSNLTGLQKRNATSQNIVSRSTKQRTADLNIKINEYNISMLKQTSKLSSRLSNKLSNFNSTGKYMPGIYSISYLQKDIIEFQSELESCILEINYLLQNKPN